MHILCSEPGSHTHMRICARRECHASRVVGLSLGRTLHSHSFFRFSDASFSHFRWPSLDLRRRRTGTTLSPGCARRPSKRIAFAFLIAGSRGDGLGFRKKGSSFGLSGLNQHQNRWRSGAWSESLHQSIVGPRERWRWGPTTPLHNNNNNPLPPLFLEVTFA